MDVSDGLKLEDAAALAGISIRTLNRWMADGRVHIAQAEAKDEDADTLEAELVLEVRRAEAFFAKNTIGYLRKAAKNGDSKAAERLLELSPRYRQDRPINLLITPEIAARLSTDELMMVLQGKTPPSLMGDQEMLALPPPAAD